MKKYYYVLGLLGLLLLPMNSIGQYCTPTFSNGCGGGDFIDGVAVGAISNTSSGCSAGNYNDYTATMSTGMNQTLSYNVTVTNNPQWGEGFGVFIDWNQDLDFNDTDEFFGNAVVTAGGGTDVISVTVPSGALLGATRMRVIANYNTAVNATGSCGGWTYGEAEDYEIVVAAAPACPPATGLTVSGVLATSADISWTAASGATDYNIEWDSQGFTPGTGASTGSAMAVAALTFNATGLSSQTDYQFFVQTNCGGGSTSPWAASSAFTTPCQALVAPWVENFSVTSTPVCWDQTAGGGGSWVFTGNPGYTASNTADHTNSVPNNYAWIDHSGTDADVQLISPIIDVAALNTPELRFWIWSHYDGALSPYNITYVEANDGTGWQNLVTVQGDFGPQWTEFNVIIPPTMFLGNDLVQVRFRAESGGAGLDFYNDILLDDVSIIEAPTCPAPTDFALVDAKTDSAFFSWTPGLAGETEWWLEYGAPGFAPLTGAGTTYLTNNNNPDSLGGLTPNTFYEVYLRAACTPGDSSFLVGPISFNTFNQPQYMEFDNECGPGFVDITATGTDLNLTDDSESGLFLAFPWLVQNVQVNNLTVGNNGGVLLNTTTGQVGYTMTSGDGFYPFVQDLDNDIAGVNQVGVLWEVQGTAPNRQLIIMWKDRTHFSGATNLDPCTFEMIYMEGSNEVYYTYPDVDFSNGSYDNGADAEIGYRGPQDVTVSINNAQYLNENSCVHLYYTDCPKPTDLIFQYSTPDEAGYSWTAGLSNETEWIVIYDTAGFDPTAGGTTLLATPNPSIIITGLDQKTQYDIYVYAKCASGDTSLALSGTFLTKPFCSDPTGVNAGTAVDSLFSAWTWTEFSPTYPATGFNTVYGDLGFDPTTDGTTFNGDVMWDSDTIPDATFLAGGVYEMYVRAVCGTFSSSLVGSVTFTMPLTNDSVCGAETLIVDATSHNFSNVGATVQVGENAIAPAATGSQQTDGWNNSNVDFTTWFKFVAPASGQIRVSGVDAGFDGQVALYELTDCSDFGSFTLLAANDDEIDGESLAPNFTFCGLTAGNEYFLMHDAFSTSTPGTYSLKLSEVSLEAGTTPGVLDICSKDTISLFNAITGNQQGGFWVDLENTFHLVNDSLFATTGLAYETYQFEYRLIDGCATDSIIASYKVFPPSSAGEDGSKTICKNQPIGLLGVLGGVINAGGTWFDTNGDATDQDVIAGQLDLPGSYNFLYTVGNGVCPDDSSVVTINVDNSCDWLGIEDLTGGQLNVYPNPTQGLVGITNSANEASFELTVMDINGKIVFADNKAVIGSKEYTLDLSKVENGVYIVRFTQGAQFQMVRLIKQ